MKRFVEYIIHQADDDNYWRDEKHREDIIEDFELPHSSSTKKVKDAIPEIELIPIQYKNEWIGDIKK